MSQRYRTIVEGSPVPDDEPIRDPIPRYDNQEPAPYSVKVTRAGWFNFEGFGRPFEGWYDAAGEVGGWHSAGRAFTWPGARRKAKRRAIRGHHELYNSAFNSKSGY